MKVNEAATIMVAASSPAIRGARVSSGAVRQAGLNLMKKKIKNQEKYEYFYNFICDMS